MAAPEQLSASNVHAAMCSTNLQQQFRCLLAAFIDDTTLSYMCAGPLACPVISFTLTDRKVHSDNPEIKAFIRGR